MKARLPKHTNKFTYVTKNIREKSERTMKEKWIEFQNDLINSDCPYDDTDKALEITFLKQFDDLFKNVGIDKLPVVLSQDFENNYIGRGAVLKESEKLSYGRFIPNKEYIKEDNRFSPPGVEWLYLAVGNSDQAALKCSEKECKAKVGDRFGFCHFDLMPQYGNLKVIDLTIADNKTYDEIDKIAYLEYERLYEIRLKKLKKCGYWMSQIVNEEEDAITTNALQKWVLLTYCKIMSEKIFEPVANANKSIEYKPFQTLAKYFENLGYVGVKYKSTVFDGANNIVIFDKSFAQPCGDIRDYYISY